MLVTTSELLKQAALQNIAVPQFNVWNCEMLYGVLDAVEKYGNPVILACGPSFLNPKELGLFSKILVSGAQTLKSPVAVHMDHSHTLDELENAIALGYTSFMMDGSMLSLEDNIALVSEAKKYASKFNVSIEAELGYIGSESGEDKVVKYISTTAEDAKALTSASLCDALAVSIGNAHGVYKETPKLDFDALDRINSTTETPLVLHGGSGICDKDIQKAIKTGINKINFHTELCQAAQTVTETAYKKRFALVRQAICNKACEKIELTRFIKL